MAESNYAEAPALVEKIEAYLEYDGPNSYTEMVAKLCGLAYSMDYMSDSFQIALVDELKDCLKNYQQNTRIVETKQTYTHNIKEVEWL